MPRRSSTFLRRRGGAAVALVLFLLAPVTLAQNTADDVLLFAVRLDYVDLSDSFPAYERDGKYLFPLGELSRLLSLAIETDAAEGKASGFVIRQSRRFELDLKAGTVKAGESVFDVRSRLIEAKEDDIYVETVALSEWLPIDFKIDPLDSRVTVTAREPLPIHMRRDREARLQSMTVGDVDDEALPVARVPYALADGPFIDQRLSFLSTPSRRGEVQFTTLATGDLLYSQADLYLSGTTDNPGAETRFTLSRKDPFATLLGPLRAREVAAGDVFLPGDDVLLNAASGNGVVLSNYPLLRQTQFGSHSFRGNLPPGWDAELYQNGALIRYEQSRADGLYEFTDVPLVFGPNLFRIVFYGPLGERREEIYRFNIGEELAPAGKTYYRVIANQDRNDDRRAYGDFEYGLRNNLSVSMAVAAARAAGIDDEYARAGVSGYWSRLFAHADLARSNDGGSVARMFAQSRVGSVDVYGEYAVLSDFVSDVYRPIYGKVTRDAVVRFDGFLQPSKTIAIPVNLELRRQDLAGRGVVYELQQRTAAQIGSTFLSNQLGGLAIVDHPSFDVRSLRGSLIGSRLMRSIAVRGEVAYAIEPDFELENLALLGESFHFPGYVLQLGLKRAFALRDTGIILAANRNEGKFAAGISAGYSKIEGVTFAVNVFAGIARNSRSREWTTSSRPVASSGGAAARVFLDQNGNGIWDEGESPLEGAGFFVDRVSYRDLTDAAGAALITGISPYDVHRVAISPSTLEDPLLVPGTDAIRFVPRPGKAQVVDFPVLMTGEVTGTAFYRTAGTSRPAPGLRIELVRGSEVVAETRSAYDGYYQFTTVRPGRYALRAKADQATRVGISPAVMREVTIDANGSILDGVNLVFDRGAPNAQPAAVVKTHVTVSGRIKACEKPIGGVTLFLFGPAGSVETKTASDGSFSFTGVERGTYLVVVARETLPANFSAGELPRVKVNVTGDVSDLAVDLECRPSGI